ncbi:MAG: hypothetical protein BMS9Abin05_2700 [Rhodothermia bacterium]|nr:MAG: hypothetical protein BMS9Abin05_2700 [Rhodothermia bacterium]
MVRKVGRFFQSTTGLVPLRLQIATLEIRTLLLEAGTLALLKSVLSIIDNNCQFAILPVYEYNS